MTQIKNKSIKVLQVTGLMNRGGTEVMIMDIYRNIPSNIEFDFLVNFKTNNGIIKGDFDTEINDLGGKIYHIGAQWDIGPIQYIKHFIRICKKVNPDAVHIHMNAKSGLIAMAAKFAGVNKIIVHSHANIKNRGGKLKKILSDLELYFQKWLITSFSTHHWACSQEASNSLFFNFLSKKNKQLIVNNAIDVKKFQSVNSSKTKFLREKYNLKENEIIIGNVGRIVKHKNISFIIDVLNLLVKEKTDVKFVFAGRIDNEQYFKSVIEKIENYKLESNVVYLGDVSNVNEVMSTFDIFVGPALREGFGIVALEAQASGIPCVLYTGFPKMVDMELGLVSFVNNFELHNWSKRIMDMSKLKSTIPKDKIYKSILEKGFDSNNNVHIISQNYLL